MSQCLKKDLPHYAKTPINETGLTDNVTCLTFMMIRFLQDLLYWQNPPPVVFRMCIRFIQRDTECVYMCNTLLIKF